MEWLNDKAEQINKPLTSDSAEKTEMLVERILLNFDFGFGFD